MKHYDEYIKYVLTVCFYRIVFVDKLFKSLHF